MIKSVLKLLISPIFFLLFNKFKNKYFGYLFWGHYKSPEDILKMIVKSKLSPNSLILGTRFKGSEVRENIYKRTYYANRLMSSLFSLVHNFRISDIASCYKLMPSKFFNTLNIKENSFSIEVEILAKFLNYNQSIIEVPISYSGRSYEEGKKIKSIDGISYILKTFKYRFFK